MRLQHWLVLFASATIVLGQMPGRPPGSGFPQQEPSGVPGLDNGTMPPLEHQVDEREFVREAAVSSLAGVELGKLAAQKGSSEEVRQFGQKTADQESKVNQELKTAADQASVKTPDTLDSKRRSRVDKLSKLSGAAFDKEYVKDQIRDQEQDVQAFEDEAEHGTNQNLRDFANKNLPELRQTLEAARALKKGTEARD